MTTEEKIKMLEERTEELQENIADLIKKGSRKNSCKLWHSRKALETTRVMLNVIRREFEKSKKLQTQTGNRKFF